MPKISPTMLSLLDRVRREELYVFSVQREGVRESTIFALKDRGLIEFGNFKPNHGRQLVATTTGLALLSAFASAPEED